MEDDDAFLYGDNNEEKTQQTLEQENKEVHEITNVGSDKESNKSKDQAETSLYKDENPATVSDDNKSANASDDDDKESANESGSEYDDDSDDSLEVIISTKKEEEEKKEAEKEEKETDGATLLNSVQESLATLKGGQGKLDMLTVPLIKDIDMYEFDIDTLEDKAWRKPGADITDYFNFGFTEQTWKVYCLKQKRLRSELTTRTMVNATGGDDKMDISAEVRALSSGMGSMLGGSMPNLPGMPNLPNLAMLGASMNPEMMMRSQMMMGPGVPPNIPPFFPNAIQRPPMPNMMGGPQGQQNDPNRNLPKTSMNIQPSMAQMSGISSDNTQAIKQPGMSAPEDIEKTTSTTGQPPVSSFMPISNGGHPPPFMPHGFNPNAPGHNMPRPNQPNMMMGQMPIRGPQGQMAPPQGMHGGNMPMGIRPPFNQQGGGMPPQFGPNRPPMPLQQQGPHPPNMPTQNPNNPLPPPPSSRPPQQSHSRRNTDADRESSYEPQEGDESDRSHRRSRRNRSRTSSKVDRYQTGDDTSSRTHSRQRRSSRSRDRNRSHRHQSKRPRSASRSDDERSYRSKESRNRRASSRDKERRSKRRH